MSERRLKLMEIREMLRHIREKRSDRQIGKDLGVDRRTVKRYRQWAQEQGLLKGELPDHQSLLQLLDKTLPEKMPPQNSSKAGAYRERIAQHPRLHPEQGPRNEEDREASPERSVEERRGEV